MVVTAGYGKLHCEGVPVVETRAGDVTRCPPGHKHWHSATPIYAMTHTGIHEALDGKNADWLEHVTVKQCLAGPLRDGEEPLSSRADSASLSSRKVPL